MAEDKKVRDIMAPIEEYDMIDIDSQLCDALSILKRNYETLKTQDTGNFHKTLFVIDGDDKIVGKLSMYDLIRSLVPEPAKAPEISKTYHAMLSSRSLEVVEEVSDFQEHFKWLSSTFSELVRQETHKKVRDVMNPVVESVLIEEDKINQAIYVMFKEDVRQQLVHREGKIVGVINLNTIFSELLEVVGPECGITW